MLDRILNWGPISRIRRNHAMEHATLNLLAQGEKRLMLAGYSDTHGFWVMGEISTDLLQKAVDEARLRLQNGESGLAVHAHCGTNYAASGVVAGSAAYLGMAGGGRLIRSKWDRWSLVVGLVTIALIFSQPLGPYLQANFTTQSLIGRLKVTAITRYQNRRVPVHRILTIDER